MEKVAGNDVIECWGFRKKDFINLERTVTHHDRQVCDQRAVRMLSLVHSMYTQAGVSVINADPARTAILAAEAVDAAWNECKHRGWIIEVPSFDEIV